jgi:hypothetical protein
MFTFPRANLFESDAGFSVEVLGRTGLRYREDSKSMFVDSEILTRGNGIQIFTKSIAKWDPPNHEELLTKEDKAHIIRNIREVFEFQKQPVIIT